jgi:hypothetical protein
MGVAYEVELRESFDFALREAGAHFMKEGRLHESLHRLAARLETEGIDESVRSTYLDLCRAARAGTD